VQIATRLKYGHEHIKSIVTAETILSIRRRGVEDTFRDFDEALRPRLALSADLLEDFTHKDGVVDSHCVCVANDVQGLDKIVSEPGLSELMGEPKPIRGRHGAQEFFKVVLKNPKKS
jgi:hypothetical protein